MIYSVWNQAAKAYDYYETPGSPTTVNAASPKHLRQAKLGLTSVQASWPLPAGAQRTGSGTLARGRIAHPRGGSGLGSVTDSAFGLVSSPFGFVIAGGLIFAAWKLSQVDTDRWAAPKRRRRR